MARSRTRRKDSYLNEREKVGNTALGATVGAELNASSKAFRAPLVCAVEEKAGYRMDNQSPRFGAQDSQEPPFYAPGQWTYQVQSAMDPLQYPQSQQVMNVMGGPIYQEDVQIVEPPPPRIRKVKEKKVSRRGGGGGFTKEEDEVLCSTFANVSKDPTIGVNQTHGGYYKRMHDYYNTYKPEGCDLSQLVVQSRWLGIQISLNKFCGFKAAVDRRNESGKNEQDRIDDAVKIYEATEPFQFMHCWRILKDEPKWNEKLLELNGTSTGTGDEGASQANSGPDNSVPPRPEGRNNAKKKRVTDASSSSSAVDVLQRIHDNREKCQQKEDEQMQLILASRF
ncbi:hypothetical protein EJB05_34030, partial [Eragrostis curvula]